MPPPDTTEPRFNWGVLGTGNIARQFCAGMKNASRSRLHAVASRSAEPARAFSSQFDIPAHYDNYDALLHDPAIDGVYISLPNNLHHEWTIKALRAGRHVLCEKPIATSAQQAQEMFDVARAEQRVLMEAFMYRCHPLMDTIREKVDQGAIGQLKIIRTSFCFRVRKPEGNIRFDPELSGGALMDVGCYCINFSRFFAAGEPVHVSAAATRHATGVDESVVGTIHFSTGVLAHFAVSMSAQADNSAWLLGDEGYIQVPVPWKPPQLNAQLIVGGGIPTKMDQPAGGPPVGAPVPQTFFAHADTELYANEADCFARACLGEQALPVNEADTLGNMRVIDAMREQIRHQWSKLSQ